MEIYFRERKKNVFRRIRKCYLRVSRLNRKMDNNFQRLKIVIYSLLERHGLILIISNILQYSKILSNVNRSSHIHNTRYRYNFIYIKFAPKLRNIKYIMYVYFRENFEPNSTRFFCFVHLHLRLRFDNFMCAYMVVVINTRDRLLLVPACQPSYSRYKARARLTRAGG